jgi:ATP adenylyltransferase
VDDFVPGTLDALLREATERARRSGHLEPIPTEAFPFERAGIRFVVRVAAELARKKKAATRVDRDPFLPYEEEMFVAGAGDGHVLLLNKFNVVDHHLLIVTRAFEDQRALLTEDDVRAMERCLAEIDGLAFYNGGTAAGASQPHKHLQLVPRAGDRAAVPIEPLCSTLGAPAIDPIDAFPFVHAGASDCSFQVLCALMTLLERDPRTDTARRIEGASIPGGQSFPYNLLATRRFMLLIPRTSETSRGIPINALGFAGSFLAKTPAERAIIEADPLDLLAGAAIDRRR